MGTSISSLRVNAEGGSVSDRTRQVRDEEQQHLADEAMRSAMRLIREHREQLDALAFALLRNEVLLREDIERIMGTAAKVEPGRGGLRVVAATDGD
jgi:cell division protease FtsH